MPLRQFLVKCLLVVCALFTATGARADPADISAAGRNVVRVVLVATNGESYYFVGHGSGIAVSPTKVVTNAHVLELLREDPSIMIGVVPAEGKSSFRAKLTAVSPGNDLALIELAEAGRLSPATLFSGPLEDGMDVFAIGYPGTVDSAQGLQLGDLIRPQSPVKTRGTLSGGRSSKRFDTILHTAAIGSGNSGGPLVDNCGRVIGINSFGTVSDVADSEFYFAVSMRELLPFLRKADVQPRIASTACRSMEELIRAESQREAASASRSERAQMIARENRERAESRARRAAELDILAERDNGLAIAALLLALSVLTAGGSAWFFQRGQRQQGIAATGLGLALLIGAMAVWLSRPGFAEVEDRIMEKLPKSAAQNNNASYSAEGDNLCVIDQESSRITLSETPDVRLRWTAGGCVNGRTQYGQGDTGWSRVFAPNQEAAVSIASFDPDTGRYVVDRYLLSADEMADIRDIRGRYNVEKCSADPEVSRKLGEMQDSIRAALPAAPNEHLVYRCTRQRAQ